VGRERELLYQWQVATVFSHGSMRSRRVRKPFIFDSSCRLNLCHRVRGSSFALLRSWLTRPDLVPKPRAEKRRGSALAPSKEIWCNAAQSGIFLCADMQQTSYKQGRLPLYPLSLMASLNLLDEEVGSLRCSIERWSSPWNLVT
jgi:hypothetical protein